MRFLLAYMFCCLVFGAIVASNEFQWKKVRWKYVLGTFLFPSFMFGNWRHNVQASVPEPKSKNYLVLTWMARIHIMVLVVGILIPMRFIRENIEKSPEVHTGHASAAGFELLINASMFWVSAQSGTEMFLVFAVVVFVGIYLPFKLRSVK